MMEANSLNLDFQMFFKQPKTIKTESVAIEKLKEHPLNKAIYKDEESTIKEMMVSIQTGGVLNKIVANVNYMIVSGHLRWQALCELKKMDALSDNSTNRYDTVEVDLKEFSEDTMTEEEYLLTSNEGRIKTIIDQLHETERWIEIFKQPKYKAYKDKKDEFIAHKVGLSSSRMFDRVKRAIKYIESLKETEDPSYSIDRFFKLIEEKKSFTAIDNLIKKLKNKPTGKELSGKTKEELDDICREFDLDFDVDQFDNQKNPLKAFIEAIANALGIKLNDPEEEEEEENESREYTYEELKGLSKEDLISIVRRRSLDVEIDDFVGYKNPIFLCREVAGELKIDVPRFSVSELISLNLKDLMAFVRKKKLKLNVKDYKDPLPVYQNKLAEFYDIPKNELNDVLTKPLRTANYEKTNRSIQFGRMEMRIKRGPKGGLPIIQVFAGVNTDKISKLAELLTHINSDNIDGLLNEAKKK